MLLRIRISPSPRSCLAGLDGIQSRIDPGDPLDKNLYELPPEELANVPSVPDSLIGAIKALEADHSFLLKGDVFNSDFIANWIEMKTKGIRRPASPTASVRVRDVLRRVSFCFAARAASRYRDLICQRN
jgi:glutamine synthetase